MVLKNFLAGFGLACSAALLFAGQAIAQNTLPGASGPGEDIPDDASLFSNADLVADGYIMFDIAQMKKLFGQIGYEVVEESNLSAAENGGINSTVVIMANDYLAHVFLFQDCDGAGCAWFQLINPIPTAEHNIPITLSDINEFNQAMPYGHATFEEGANMAVRLSMKTLPKCDTACIEEQVGAYLSTVDVTHEILLELKNGANTVLNDDLPDRFALRSTAPIVKTGVASGAVSALRHDGLGFNLEDFQKTGVVSDLIAWPEATNKGKFPPLLEPVERH